MSRKILTAMVACGAALGVLPTAALAQAQGQTDSFLPQPSVPVAPNVPTVVELAKTDEQRKILSAVVNAAEIGTASWLRCA